MRALFVALIGCLSMAACSLQSPTSEAHSNLLGMTQKQISSCLVRSYTEDHRRCFRRLVIWGGPVLFGKDLLCVRPREPCELRWAQWQTTVARR